MIEFIREYYWDINTFAPLIITGALLYISRVLAGILVIVAMINESHK